MTPNLISVCTVSIQAPVGITISIETQGVRKRVIETLIISISMDSLESIIPRDQS